MNEPSPTIAFEEFEIDTFHRRLLRRGEPVVLTAKAFDVLAFLVENNGRVVAKDEILDSVWGDRFVEESNLVVQISNLRRILGETPNSPRFLATVPGKGYKFAADIDQNTFVVETHTVSELTIEQQEITRRYLPFRLPWLAMAGSGIVVLFAAAGLAMFWNRSPEPVRAAQISYSKVTTTGKVTAATMSPDGRFAVFSQKEDPGESLWLRQLETGSESRIVEPKPVEYIGMTISPDGQYIYASVFSKNEIDPSVFRFPIIGGTGVRIPNVTTGSSITISPDGGRFAFTSSNNGENETLFGVANIDGSELRILMHARHDERYLTMFQSSPVAWSPDGTEIALAAHEKREPGALSAILMVDPATGAERSLTGRRWKDIEDLVWIDADRLAFIASEENGPADQIWIYSKAAGDVRQVTNDLRPHSWLAAGGGKLLTVQLTATTSLRIGELDDARKTVSSREFFSASEYVDELDWAPDGSIVYASRAAGTSELWKMNPDGTGQRQMTNGASVAFGVSVASRDGSVVFAAKRDGKRGIWTSTPDGESLRMLTGGADQAPDVSADGKVVFHRGIGYAEGVFVVSAVEPTPRLLREKCYFPAISQDGELAACYFMDLKADRKWRIALISTSTGGLIRELDIPVAIYDRQIRFHPDGRHITQLFSSGPSLSLLLLPIDGSEPTLIENLGKGNSHVPEWKSDGKQFLFPVISETQDAVLLSKF